MLNQAEPMDENYIDSWNSLLAVYAKCKLYDKTQRALDVIHRMEFAFIKPDIISYNTVLSACSVVNGTDEKQRLRALEISVIIFNTFNSSSFLIPDSFTYSSLLRICGKLIVIDSEREKVLPDLFHSCCKDGQVNVQVVTTLKLVSSSDLFKELLGV